MINFEDKKVDENCDMNQPKIDQICILYVWLREKSI